MTVAAPGSMPQTAVAGDDAETAHASANGGAATESATTPRNTGQWLAKPVTIGAVIARATRQPITI